METENQSNYYVVNQFQANVPFLHPLKTAKTLLFFGCVLGVKKGNIGPKWVDNSFREIISIRKNATLIYGINVQNTTSTGASLSKVSSSLFPRNLMVRASYTLNQILQNLNLIT